MKRLAIFVSGNGTNMENVIIECRAGRVPGEAALVICDNPDARAIQKAKILGVKVCLVEREKLLSKSEFEQEIIRHLKQRKIEFLVLAGFMKILSPDFVKRYTGRIVNIHPAYLPAFPGAHAIRDAFEAKVKETGVTVHFVDAGIDTGPIILQRKVTVNPKDTLEMLETKIHSVEYSLYPEALRLLLSGKVKI